MWRCLVVQDDGHNARYIADGFRELGHVAIVCHDGAEALMRSTAELWDLIVYLIVLDRMLPHGVDGLSILSTLCALGKKTPAQLF